MTCDHQKQLAKHKEAIAIAIDMLEVIQTFNLRDPKDVAEYALRQIRDCLKD